MRNRVNVVEMDFDEYCCFTYNGEPLTGIGYEVDENQVVISEVNFVNGVKDGLAIDFYSPTRKKSEFNYRRNLLEGTGQEWFESGKLKRRTLHELGVLVESDEWNETGEHTFSYKLAATDPNFLLLEQLRRAKWK